MISENQLEIPPALHELGQEECFRLLATQEVGRLGVQAGPYPLIFPVNYALDGNVIVIRTNRGLKMRAAASSYVSFEVDDIDRFRRIGWSVLVRGMAQDVSKQYDDEVVERTRATGLQPWPAGEHGLWIRILPHEVSGRQIMPVEPPPAFEPSGYL